MSITTRNDDAAPDVQQRGAWRLVAMREIQVRLRDRNFLISTGFTVVLLIGLLVLQAFIAGGAPSYRVAVSESASGAEQLVSSAQETLRGGDEEAEVTSVQVADAAAARAAVTDGDVDVALTGQEGDWSLTADGDPPGELQQALADAVRTDALSSNAEGAGTSVSDLMAGTRLAVEDVSPDDGRQEGVALVAGFIFAMLFYLSALMFGLAIAQSVVEEKQSRIVEILAAAIPVRQLLTGKVLGNTVLAFGQLVFITAVGLIGITFTEYDQFLPMISGAVLWYIPFFVFGFLALACVWAAFGALAQRNEDLQATTMPLTMALVAIFVVGLNLEGAARAIGSFVPVLSTLLMPIRILQDGVGWWEPAVSLLLTLAFCALTIRFGSTLYRRALLQTQGRLSIRKAMAIRD